MVTLNPGNKSRDSPKQTYLDIVALRRLSHHGRETNDAAHRRLQERVGTWKGSSVDWVGANVPKPGMRFPLILIIKEDGSFEVEAGYGAGSGTMQIRDGRIQYKSPVQGLVTVTLYEGKGKRVLKGINEADGTTWKAERAKK